jgi:hypothetical protein
VWGLSAPRDSGKLKFLPFLKDNFHTLKVCHEFSTATDFLWHSCRSVISGYEEIKHFSYRTTGCKNKVNFLYPTLPKSHFLAVFLDQMFTSEPNFMCNGSNFVAHCISFSCHAPRVLVSVGGFWVKIWSNSNKFATSEPVSSEKHHSLDGVS